jgi:hypothetical protein
VWTETKTDARKGSFMTSVNQVHLLPKAQFTARSRTNFCPISYDGCVVDNHGAHRSPPTPGRPSLSGVASRLRVDDEQGDAQLSPNPLAAPGSPESSSPRATSATPTKACRASLPQLAAGPRSPASRGASPPTCSRPSLSGLAWCISSNLQPAPGSPAWSPPPSPPRRRRRRWRRRNKSSRWYALESLTLLCFRSHASNSPAVLFCHRINDKAGSLGSSIDGHGSEESRQPLINFYTSFN